MAWRNGPTRTSTTEHRTWRRLVLAASGGQCQIRGPRCTGLATEADHIVPVTRGGAEHDPANGQGACHACHQAKTNAEAAEGRRLAATRRPRTRRPMEQHPGLMS